MHWAELKRQMDNGTDRAPMHVVIDANGSVVPGSVTSSRRRAMQLARNARQAGFTAHAKMIQRGWRGNF